MNTAWADPSERRRPSRGVAALMLLSALVADATRREDQRHAPAEPPWLHLFAAQAADDRRRQPPLARAGSDGSGGDGSGGSGGDGSGSRGREGVSVSNISAVLSLFSTSAAITIFALALALSRACARLRDASAREAAADARAAQALSLIHI